MRRPSPETVQFLRDTILFLIGCGVAINEFFLHKQPNPVALGAAVPFLFGPAVLLATGFTKSSSEPPASPEQQQHSQRS
jgi:hypothetical protein